MKYAIYIGKIFVTKLTETEYREFLEIANNDPHMNATIKEVK